MDLQSARLGPCSRLGLHTRLFQYIAKLIAATIRKDCSNAGVHNPQVAGISCSTVSTRKDANPGAFSIVLNGGYEDDVDNGYTMQVTTFHL